MSTTDTLARTLINANEANRNWLMTRRIELTDEQSAIFRQGYPEGRCPWGDASTSLGTLRWIVINEQCFQVRKGPGDVLVYEIPRPTQQEQDPPYRQCDQIGGVTVEARAFTQERIDEAVAHWNRLKRQKHTAKPTRTPRAVPPSGKEGPKSTTTYDLTAHRYIQHFTLVEKKQEEMSEEELTTLIRRGDRSYRYELEEVTVLELQTNDPLYAQTIVKKAEEWRLDHGVTALTLRVQEKGQPEHIQYYQYKRVGEATPAVAGHPEYSMKQSKARAWQAVPQINTDWKILLYANSKEEE